MEKLDLKNNKIEIILIFVSIKSGNLLQEDKKNLAELNTGKFGDLLSEKKVQEVKYPEKRRKIL